MSVAEKHEISVTLNHAATTLRVDPRQSLAAALRDELNLASVHIGCAQGQCGTCNLLLDGALVRGCLIFACQADGCNIVTMEGVLGDAAPGEIKATLIRHRALQCGYCTPGFVVLLAAILQGGHDATEAREMLSANLCRCTGYTGLIAAMDELLGAQAARTPHGAAGQA